MIQSPPEAPEEFGIDIPSMNPEFDESDGPKDRGYYSYGRRPTTYGAMRGWIVQLPYQGNLRQQYEQRRFRYLDQYGLFLMAQADGDLKYTDNKDARGVPWNSFREPWRLLFQKGGAKEFPIEQIVTAHWHLLPPYREARFPQLDEMQSSGKSVRDSIFDFQCPECYERPVIFSSLNQREAAVHLRTHLTSGVNEQHRYTPNDLKELGAELGMDLMSARVAVPRMLVPTHEAEDLPSTGEEMDLSDALNHDYECECGWAPLATHKAPQLALASHKRTAHKKE